MIPVAYFAGIVFRHWWGLGWFWAFYCGSIAALVLVPSIQTYIYFLYGMVRGRPCPTCGAYALAFGEHLTDATAEPMIRRYYQFASCEHCHRQFRVFEDGSIYEQTERAS